MHGKARGFSSAATLIGCCTGIHADVPRPIRARRTFEMSDRLGRVKFRNFTLRITSVIGGARSLAAIARWLTFLSYRRGRDHDLIDWKWINTWIKGGRGFWRL